MQLRMSGLKAPNVKTRLFRENGCELDVVEDVVAAGACGGAQDIIPSFGENHSFVDFGGMGMV